MKRLIPLLLSLSFVVACNNTTNSKTVQSSTAKAEVSSSSEAKAKPIYLTTEQFYKKVADLKTNSEEWKYLGDKPALIDFYTTWCGPCKMIAPILEKLAAEYGDQIVIYKVDTEKEPELAQLFGITSIPTLLFIPMEGKPTISSGALPEADLRDAINTIMLQKK